jgi:hypothetical protein
MLSKTEAKKLMLAAKGTEERSHFGQPAVFYGGKLVGRVHDKEEAVALRVGAIEMRDVMLEAEPDIFYITEHYRPWPMLLARLKALDRATLKALVLARIGEIDAAPRRKTRAPAKQANKKRKI